MRFSGRQRCSSLPNQFQPESLNVVQSAQNQDHDAIQRTIASWILQLGLEAAMEVILFPLLRLIGELWHRGV
ncbi:MAG: hypothetical protein QNK38_07550, partial [Nitrospirota bacterium]|nr:hypothetical protein [Nitrospirota bacterium]MDX2420967.1 hypothetical protein [Nitrospirota bacterium]